MKIVVRAAILAFVATLLAGCGSSTSLPPSQGGDQPIDFTLLTDVPILSGATMDNERSLILGDRDRWTGRVVMKVWKPAIESTAFYQQQMPAFGWEPVMAVTSGISVMSFTRGDRAATVHIEGGTMWGSTVSLTVAARHSSFGTGASLGAGAAVPSPAYEPMPRPAPVERVRSEPLPSRR